MAMRHDNELLVEFDFLINMDIAMYYYVKENFAESPYVNKQLMDVPYEDAVNQLLLNRKHINPLELIIPGMDTMELYKDLMANHEAELLEYAKAYDTFPLMITYLNLSSVGIMVLCKNDLEVQFINKLNNRLKCMVVADRSKVNLRPYTVIYVKYFASLIEFPVINGKNIFIAAAKFNMEDDEDCVDKRLTLLYTQSNDVHLIDLYRDMKFRFNREKDK